MGMPTALTGQAYNIVDNAMATGARGSVTKTTDYSGLSDAFFKKASLDTQIGGMLMDQQMERARLTATIDMHKADLMMQQADLQMRDAHFQQQRKDAADADKMSPFEKITGVLAGAATGVATGARFGKPGMIIGGVIGGATALGQGNSRRAQANALDNLGMVANASKLFSENNKIYKAEDALETWSDTFNKLSSKVREAEPGSQEQQVAQANLDAHIDGYTEVGLRNGQNLQQIAQGQAALKNQVWGYDQDDPKQVAEHKMRKIKTDAMAEVGPYEGFNDPNHKNFRNARQQFQADMTETYGMGFNKDLSNSQMQAIMGSTGGVENARAYYNLSKIPTSPTSGTGGGGQTSNLSTGGGSSAMAPKKVMLEEETNVTSGVTPPDDGTTGSNYVMAPSGGGSAASNAWGMDMDHGPEQMLANAQSNFTKAAEADPSLIDKSLGRADDYETKIKQYLNEGYSMQEAEAAAKAEMKHEDNKSFKRKPGGGLLDRILPPSQYERDMARKEGRLTETKNISTAEKNKTQVAEYEAEREQNLKNMSEADKIYFTSTDPEEIKNALVKDQKLDTQSGEKLKMAANLTSAPAEMNELKGEWKKFGDKHLRNMTPEQQAAAVRAFEVTRYGQGGPGKDLSMESVGGGVAAFGTQAHFQMFKTNFEMQLEGAGTLPDEQLRAMYDDFFVLDSETTAVQATMAKNQMGGQLSDRDVSMYMLRGAADPNDVTVRRVIERHQARQLKQAKSLLLYWGEPKGKSGGGSGSSKRDTTRDPNDPVMLF